MAAGKRNQRYLNITGVAAIIFLLVIIFSVGYDAITGTAIFAPEESATPDVIWIFNSAESALFDSATGDFDDDGKEEVAAIGIEFSAYLVDDDGSLIWENSSYQGERIAAGDFDGDNTPEIAIGDYNNFLVILDASGDEVEYGADLELEEGCMPTDVEMGNIFGDGKDSVVIGDYCGGSTLYGINQTGNWNQSISINAIALGDLTGDGLPDVAKIDLGTAAEGGEEDCVWTEECAGICGGEGGYTDGEGCYVDSDCKNPCEFTLSAYRGYDGEFLWSCNYTGQAVEIGDVVGDSNNEVVAGLFEDGNYIAVFNKTGGNECDPNYYKWVNGTVIDIELGDIAGDSKKEIIAITDSTGGGPEPSPHFTVYALSGNASELWTKNYTGWNPSDFYVAREIDLLRIADIDDDDKNEIIIGTDDGWIYAYDGDGSLVWEFDAANINESLDRVPIFDIETADFNEDGVDDVLVLCGNYMFVLGNFYGEEKPPRHGGGGGGIGSTSYQFTQQQQTFTLNFNSKIFFTFGNQSHYLILSGIYSNYINFGIYSTPQMFKLDLGQTKAVDIDGDGASDLSVKLIGISEDSRSATIGLARGAWAAPVPAQPEGITEPPAEAAGAAEGAEGAAPETKALPTIPVAYLALSILVIILVLSLSAYAIHRGKPAEEVAVSVEDRLANYIINGIRMGYTPEIIKRVLVRAGWPEHVVDAAINRVLKQRPY